MRASLLLRRYGRRRSQGAQDNIARKFVNLVWVFATRCTSVTPRFAREVLEEGGVGPLVVDELPER